MISIVVARARRRLLANTIAREGARAVCTGMGVLVLLLIFGSGILSWRWIWIVPSITFAAGVCAAFARLPDAYAAAQRIDSRLRLVDTLSTAVFFLAPRPARPCDEGVRQSQWERAERMAAGVDVRAALPLCVPRRICACASMLAVVAAGLVMLRYHFAGRVDLRAPVSAAMLQLLHETKAELARLEQKIETPAADRDEGDPAPEDAGSSENAEGNVADAEDSAKSEDSSGEADRAEKQDRAESAADGAEAENRQPGEQQQENGEQQEQNGENASARREANSEERQGEQDSSQQGAQQDGSSSSLLAKVSDAMSKLASVLKPPSGRSQGKSQGQNRPSESGKQESEAGAGSRQSQQGSASRGAEQTSKADDAHAGMGATAPNEDPRGEARPGSGAGRDDGNKEIKAAEQLEAMGKISVILGKRSKDLTGTAYAEVTSGPQQLKTGYEARRVEHADVRAKADRDEIPLEFQGYVEQYFREMRKAGSGHEGKRP